MICENCKQRPATVTVTQMKDGQQFAKHFCETCSKQSDVVNAISNDDAQQPISIAQLFSSWFGVPTLSSSAPQSTQTTQNDKHCKGCNMTYSQFLQEGKFNCPHCYTTFSEQLPNVFKRLHNGAVEHKGKVPSGLNASYQLKKEIELLRQQMKEVIESENFEEAATLRDKIYELEAKLKQGGAHNQ